MKPLLPISIALLLGSISLSCKKQNVLPPEAAFSISGQVLDLVSGAPIQGIQVSFGTHCNKGYHDEKVEQTAFSDKNGFYHFGFDGDPNCEYFVHANSAFSLVHNVTTQFDSAFWGESITFFPEKNATQDISLHPATNLTIQAVDAQNPQVSVPIYLNIFIYGTSACWCNEISTTRAKGNGWTHYFWREKNTQGIFRDSVFTVAGQDNRLILEY